MNRIQWYKYRQNLNQKSKDGYDKIAKRGKVLTKTNLQKTTNSVVMQIIVYTEIEKFILILFCGRLYDA